MWRGGAVVERDTEGTPHDRRVYYVAQWFDRLGEEWENEPLMDPFSAIIIMLLAVMVWELLDIRGEWSKRTAVGKVGLLAGIPFRLLGALLFTALIALLAIPYVALFALMFIPNAFWRAYKRAAIAEEDDGR